MTEKGEMSVFEQEAAVIVAELTDAYRDQNLASLLLGGKLAAMIARRIDQQLQKLSSHLQGVEAEMRRARDVLPVDWETQRFDAYVRSADGEFVRLYGSAK